MAYSHTHTHKPCSACTTLARAIDNTILQRPIDPDQFGIGTGIITINARSHRIKTFPRALDFIAVQSVVAVAAGADAAVVRPTFAKALFDAVRTAPEWPILCGRTAVARLLVAWWW